MQPVPEVVVDAWPGLTVGQAPYGTGLINVTLKGQLRGRPVIVQRVHPAFAPAVHFDIEAITVHLTRRSLLTPRLIRTKTDELCAVDGEGRAWRLLSFIDNSFSHDRFTTTAFTREAGKVVGRHHAALSDLSWSYVHTRPGIHDVGFRMRGLEAALARHTEHRLLAEVRELRQRLLRLEPLLLPQDVTPARHAHGDLKASNILFDEQGSGLCLVDLDTLAHMAWPFEMGDAIRSWCNPRREDEPGAGIELDLYEAALQGYREGSGPLQLSATEIELLPRGVLTIAVELALRFLTDALEERYFSFDPARYATHGEHNLARAKGQIELALSVEAALAELDRITKSALVP